MWLLLRSFPLIHLDISEGRGRDETIPSTKSPLSIVKGSRFSCEGSKYGLVDERIHLNTSFVHEAN